MTIETGIPRKHVIAATMAAWGHAKSACALLSKIVRYRPVHATIMVDLRIFDKVVKEIDAQFLPRVEDDMRKLIRVVALESGPNPFNLALFSENFTKEYKRLLDKKGDSTNLEVSPGDFEPGPPQLVILDFFLYETLQCIREVTGHSVPVYALQSGAAVAHVFMFGPEGRFSNLDEELKAIPYTDQEAYLDEADKIFKRSSGKLIQVPGIPLLYDYEYLPQKSVMPREISVLHASGHKFMKECDGAVMNTISLLEGPAIKAFEEWFAGNPVISCGTWDFPLIPRQEESPTKTEVEAFLNSALEKYGPHSVVYVSLGSFFWPTEPEKMWAVLDVLIDQGVPFVFAHASPLTVVPDKVKEKINASGLGYSSNWVPQTTILNHKACGWILTHCGQNSVTEALSAGVPLICWPFAGDQPTNAANIAFVHNLGYELFEVRSDDGLRPIHRLGDKTPEGTVEAVKREFLETLEKVKGEDGAIKRANAQRFRDELAKLWAPGGDNWKEIQRIVEVLQ